MSESTSDEVHDENIEFNELLRQIDAHTEEERQSTIEFIEGC